MTAVAVELCGCSHAERMHERDVDAENGRGACMARGGDCGCSEFRPGLVGVEVPDPPVEAVEPVEAEEQIEEQAEEQAEVVDPPLVVPIAAPAPSSPSFSCGSCDRRFTSKQALGGHTSRGHKTRAVADAPPVAPDQPIDGPREVTAAFASELAAVPHRGREVEGRVDPHRGLPTEAPAAANPPAAAGDLADVVKHGLAMVISDDDVALLRAAAGIGRVEAGPVVVDRDVVLIGLVRALDAAMTADASDVVETALDIQRYMDDRGWRVIDGGPR